MERGTWELTKLPRRKKLVSVKWDFKVQTNAYESLDKYKARLVVKGYTQIQGEDFFWIFTPVSDYTTAVTSARREDLNARSYMRT